MCVACLHLCCGLSSPELTAGFGLVSGWVSPLSIGTVCFALFPFYQGAQTEVDDLFC